MTGMQRQLILVTGLSGAGKSTALKYLEDIGYETVDNLPLALLQPLVDLPSSRALAIGIDCRTRDFAATALLKQLDLLRAQGGWAISLVYFDSGDESLIRRFMATRRRHPLADDRPVMDGIALERELTAPLRTAADFMLDTSMMNLPELRQWLQGHFARSASSQLAVQLVSFSFRNGLPREADLVFDVRFLKNPHYVPALQPYSGENADVGRYIAGDPAFAPFFDKTAEMLLSLLPHYGREGKQYLTIAVGCTGGRHRSVYVAARLAQLLTDKGYDARLSHRDKDKSEGSL